MLKKLIKYDLMADYGKYSIAFIGLLLISIVILFLDKMTAWIKDNVFFEAALSFTLMLFFLAATALFVMIAVFATIRFYKNIVRDEGYLMHTLPVPTRKLIASKLITSYIWFAAALVVVCICLGVAMGEPLWLTKIISEKDIILETLTINGMGISNSQFTSILVGYILTLIISPALILTHIYFSLALGNLFNRHKLRWSVVMFFALYCIEQAVSTAFMMFVSFDMMTFVLAATESEIDMGLTYDFIMKSEVFSIIMSVVISVVFFIGTIKIFSKKLNLE